MTLEEAVGVAAWRISSNNSYYWNDTKGCKMKLGKDKWFKGVMAWAVIFYVWGWLGARFYLFSLGLLPIALYEFKRTEGKKNTKPLSLLTSGLLVFQFLHAAGVYRFPWDVKFLFELLPVTEPVLADPFLFLSVVVLALFALLLVKYTWGSVTKLLAVILLVGALVQGYVFWPELEQMLGSPEGQELLESQKENIKDNLYYRLRRELF